MNNEDKKYEKNGDSVSRHSESRPEREEQDSYLRSSSSEKAAKEFSLETFIPDFLNALKRMYMIPIVLSLIVALVLLLYMRATFDPKYNASATLTVSVLNASSQSSPTYSVSLAKQLSATFPYIFSSDALSNMIKQDLGTNAIGGEINASAVGETNLFMVDVTAKDPQTAYNVLRSAINNCQKVADFVIGDTAMTIISEPEIPLSPINVISYKNVIVYGALIGAVIGLMIVAFSTRIKTTVKDSEDIKSILNIKSLGSIQNIGRKRRGDGVNIEVALPDVPKDFADSMRLLRSRVERACTEKGYRVILISSAMPGEGKTTVASNLAMSLAMSGKRTVLLDCDIRKPSSLNAMTSQNEAGIVEYLNNTASLEDVLCEAADNLYVINAKKPSDDAAEMLGSDRMKQLIDELLETADYIIIDSPPASVIADAVVLGDLADCIVFVVRQGYTKKYRVLDGISHLSTCNAEFLGYVMNTASSSGSGYGYGAYGRYGRYGKYGKYGKYGRYGSYGSYGRYGRYGQYGRYGSYGGYGGYGKK